MMGLPGAALRPGSRAPHARQARLQQLHHPYYMQLRANNGRERLFSFFHGDLRLPEGFFMAVVAEENEFSRMKDYRKLRAGGKSDSVAREEIWPSTAVGMKKNADEKTRLDAVKAEAVEKEAKAKEK
jgi:hypothetical protein